MMWTARAVVTLTLTYGHTMANTTPFGWRNAENSCILAYRHSVFVPCHFLCVGSSFSSSLLIYFAMEDVLEGKDFRLADAAIHVAQLTKTTLN